MKKPHIPLLAVITLIFAAFTLGFFLGRTRELSQVQISVPAQLAAPSRDNLPTEELVIPEEPVVFPIDLNAATLEQLRSLPGIGEIYAKRILAYREQHGAFSDILDLMNIEGIGEKRLEAIYDLVTIGG